MQLLTLHDISFRPVGRLISSYICIYIMTIASYRTVVDGNNLSGTIPKEIFGRILSNVGNIRALHLGNNMLRGRLSSFSISQLTNLTVLNLSHNDDIYGEVPMEYGTKLTNLRALHLGNNHLSGDSVIHVTSTSFMFQNLVYLNISHNTQLHGTILASMISPDNSRLHYTSTTSTSSSSSTAESTTSTMTNNNEDGGDGDGTMPRRRALTIMDVSNCSFTGQLTREFFYLQMIMSLSIASSSSSSTTRTDNNSTTTKSPYPHLSPELFPAVPAVPSRINSYSGDATARNLFSMVLQEQHKKSRRALNMFLYMCEPTNVDDVPRD